MDVPVMLSNRHLHLSEEDAKRLFGENGATFDHYQKGDSGPFLCKETVTVSGPKGEIGGLKILGPYRGKTQVEVLRSDIFKLGIDPPVALSGHLEGAVALTLTGSAGSITRDCAIIAHRHIHIREDIAKEHSLENGQLVRVRAPGIRGIVFEQVALCIGGRGLMMHIDMDEGNAAGIKNGDVLELLA